MLNEVICEIEMQKLWAASIRPDDRFGAEKIMPKRSRDLSFLMPPVGPQELQCDGIICGVSDYVKLRVSRAHGVQLSALMQRSGDASNCSAIFTINHALRQLGWHLDEVCETLNKSRGTVNNTIHVCRDDVKLQELGNAIALEVVRYSMNERGLNCWSAAKLDGYMIVYHALVAEMNSVSLSVNKKLTRPMLEQVFARALFHYGWSVSEIAAIRGVDKMVARSRLDMFEAGVVLLRRDLYYAILARIERIRAKKISWESVGA